MKNEELRKVKKILSAYQTINHDYLDEDDSTELKNLIMTVSQEIHMADVTDFKQFLLDQFLLTPNDDDDEMQKFYDKKWTIGFGDRSVVIYNGAEIYNGVLELLDEYIVQY